MHLDVEIPDDLAGRLGASSIDLSRRALEAFGLEEYKSERISQAELRNLLRLSRYELDGFLKAHNIWIDYTLDDFHREMDTLKRLGFKRVQLVIADAGPINYLILIGHIEVLPALFQKIILPAAVRDELNDAPPSVKEWIATPPSWIEIHQTAQVHDLVLENLDAGEEAAIALAIEFHADLLLMDERAGVKAARRKGIEVTGTLGLLAIAANSGLLNLADAFDRIKRTNFRYRQEPWTPCLPNVATIKTGPR